MSKNKYTINSQENIEAEPAESLKSVEEFNNDTAEINKLRRENTRLRCTIFILLMLLFNIAMFSTKFFSEWAKILIVILEFTGLFVYAKGHPKYDYLVKFVKKILVKESK